MNRATRLRNFFAAVSTFTFGALLFAAAQTSIAQGPPPGHDQHNPPGHDQHNPPPGHGGVPPGQANRGGPPPPPHHDHNNYNNDWRFRQDDRNHFYSHYQNDVNHWRGRSNRPNFVRGQAIPHNYNIRPVPQAYWQSVPPPPPGYQYGYYDGYVVAYNPTTRIVADVLDLVTAAVTR